MRRPFCIFWGHDLIAFLMLGMLGMEWWLSFLVVVMSILINRMSSERFHERMTEYHRWQIKTHDEHVERERMKKEEGSTGK